MLRSLRVTATLAVLLCALSGSTGRATAQECSSYQAGYDTSHISWNYTAYFGKAIGQTFYAPLSAISKITLWRPPGNVSNGGVLLSIVTVDTSVDPPRPVTTGILGERAVTVYDSDPPGQLIAMPFVFDPPLILPGPGTYAWFVRSADCSGTPGWYICSDEPNPAYPDGSYWRTSRSFTCSLGGAYDSGAQSDFVFMVDYCDVAVPTRRATWGDLKQRYR